MKFFNNCKKNNNKFYLVLNFKSINWSTTNLIYYINSTITYLHNNNNIENYL